MPRRGRPPAKPTHASVSHAAGFFVGRHYRGLLTMRLGGPVWSISDRVRNCSSSSLVSFAERRTR